MVLREQCDHETGEERDHPIQHEHAYQVLVEQEAADGRSRRKPHVLHQVHQGEALRAFFQLAHVRHHGGEHREQSVAGAEADHDGSDHTAGAAYGCRPELGEPDDH